MVRNELLTDVVFPENEVYAWDLKDYTDFDDTPTGRVVQLFHKTDGRVIATIEAFYPYDIETTEYPAYGPRVELRWISVQKAVDYLVRFYLERKG